MASQPLEARWGARNRPLCHHPPKQLTLPGAQMSRAETIHRHLELQLNHKHLLCSSGLPGCEEASHITRLTFFLTTWAPLSPGTWKNTAGSMGTAQCSGMSSWRCWKQRKAAVWGTSNQTIGIFEAALLTASGTGIQPAMWQIHRTSREGEVKLGMAHSSKPSTAGSPWQSPSRSLSLLESFPKN